MMRKTISEPSVGARPHRNDAAVKPTTDVISRRLRPKTLASQPVIGRMIALATRYDVSAHVASSMVADRLPAMCGSDTLTTVVSSTSMKVANMTETAMSQGLMTRCGESLIRAREPRTGGIDALMNPYLVYTVGVTDMPGRSGEVAHPARARARSSPVRAAPP